MGLEDFDIFPKFSDRNVNIRTLSGGIISILTTAWIVFLIAGNLQKIFYPQITSTVVLDNERVEGQRKVFINFDITINTPCSKLHIDLFERDSDPKTDRIDNISRIRIAENGKLVNDELENHVKANKKPLPEYPSDYCGPCYKENKIHKCCNTCQDVMDVYKAAGLDYYASDNWDQCDKEGVNDFGAESCRIYGKLKVKKQSGYFHIAQGNNIHDSSRAHTHDLQHIKKTDRLDHHIKYLTIGEPVSYYQPPLTDVEMKLPPAQNESMWMVSYFLHAVPEKQIGSDKSVDSYRYSAFPSQRRITKEMKKGYPGIVFYYDFTPMVVVTDQHRPTLREIIVDICGTIGGAFSFAAILDALMFGALSTIEGKSRIGKDL